MAEAQQQALQQATSNTAAKAAKAASNPKAEAETKPQPKGEVGSVSPIVPIDIVTLRDSTAFNGQHSTTYRTDMHVTISFNHALRMVVLQSKEKGSKLLMVPLESVKSMVPA